MPTFPQEVIDAAKQCNIDYDILASITLAQWALESNFGKDMPLNSNNPFGIKARNGEPSVIVATHEEINGERVLIHAAFAKFDTVHDAFVRHAKLLRFGLLYAKIQKFRKDYIAFAKALTGIYATDHHYGFKLVAIIKEYSLDKYDVVTKPKAASVIAVSTIAAAASVATVTQAPKVANLHVAAMVQQVSTTHVNADCALAAAIGFVIGVAIVFLYFAIEHYREETKPIHQLTDEELDMSIRNSAEILAQGVTAIVKQRDDYKAQLDSLNGSHSDLQTQLDAANAKIAQMTQDDIDSDAEIAKAAGIDLTAQPATNAEQAPQ